MNAPAPRRVAAPRLVPPEQEPQASAWRDAQRDGIWRLLDAEDLTRWRDFLGLYRAVREDEGWRRHDPSSRPSAWYRALPAVPTDDPQAFVWGIRAVSFEVLLRRIITPLANRLARPLSVIDLGAGNAWLAHRLTELGHRVAAVDVDDDSQDGLGAWRHYGDPSPFLPVQASFEKLPWPDDSFDLAIFNGALHYAADAGIALGEAVRVLAPHGRIAIVDTPFYRHEASGKAMIQERDRHFEKRHGRAPTTSHEGFLTRPRLHALGQQQGLAWRVWKPWYSLRWAMRPWQNRLLGLREPARFLVIEGAGRRARR